MAVEFDLQLDVRRASCLQLQPGRVVDAVRGGRCSGCVSVDEGVSGRYVVCRGTSKIVLADLAFAADALERYEMPYFGPLASSWVDAE